MEQEVNGFSTAQIDLILEHSYRQEQPEQAVFNVICCLGRDAENETEFHYARSHLLRLLEHPNADIRAYSILALSVMAFHWPLDQDRIIPKILLEWSAAYGSRKGWIINAVEDLQLLGWNIQLPGME